MADVQTRPARTLAGAPVLVVNLLVYLALVPLYAVAWPVAVVVTLANLAVSIGFFMLQPNQAGVLTLFGDYRGTETTPGLRWANPLLATTKVSLRVRNFTTQTSKVNDANGNPILIAANVVWQVVDTARAVFGVDDFDDYVVIQSESAIRQLARQYPYDSFDDVDVTTLIGDTGEVNDDLLGELQERTDAAGVEVLEARITDLSYAPEIAEAMLRRQQAAAIVAARAKIVEGAVLMVRDAIDQLEAGGLEGQQVELGQQLRAQFATNLMTVIASDTPTTPVVNVGR